MSDAQSETSREMLDEISPLIGVVPFCGPPIILLAGPWLLLALMLAGPFALLFTLVVALVALVALVGLIGAILAAPYLVVRHLREHLARHSLVQQRSHPPTAVSRPGAPA